MGVPNPTSRGRRRGKAKVRRGGSETAKGLTRPGGGRKDYGDRRS